jgi:hypothetical protein
MKTSLLSLMHLILIIFAAGCSENSFYSDQYESETIENQVVALSTQTDFSIENTNGSIIISTADTAKNIYCGISKKVKSKISKEDAREYLSRINIATSKDNSGVTIKVDHPKNDNRTYEIKFNILMPDNFNYNLNLGNGDITVNSSTKNLVINVGNGTVESDVVLADTCRAVISIGNGSLNLVIPGRTNATVNALVGNGTISSNGLNFQNQQSANQRFTGTLGNGTGSITLNVGNGTIIMSRK